jgi:hypothetical protein
VCAVGKGEVEGEGEVGAGPVEAKPSKGFSPTPPLPTECLASAVNRNWVFRQIPRITKSQRPEIAGKAAGGYAARRTDRAHSLSISSRRIALMRMRFPGLSI